MFTPKPVQPLGFLQELVAEDMSEEKVVLLMCRRKGKGIAGAPGEEAAAAAGSRGGGLSKWKRCLVLSEPWCGLTAALLCPSCAGGQDGAPCGPSRSNWLKEAENDFNPLTLKTKNKVYKTLCYIRGNIGASPSAAVISVTSQD